jgi:hypothetical protein
LVSVPVPERPDEYWHDFPSRIRVQLPRPRPEPAPRRTWRFRPAWAFDFALAAVLILICLQYHPLRNAAQSLTQDERNFHSQLARLDAGLHKLMLNTDGMGYLLVEAN